MTVFDYTRRLLLLLISAVWLSIVAPQEAKASLPNATKETEVQMLNIGNERHLTLIRSVTSRKRKALKKDATAFEVRKKKPSSRSSRYRGVQKNIRKPLPPLEQAQINQELSYHGILESPRRYDPSPNQKTGAVQNPKARDLKIDHFQELDKNHDGVLDPFERATSRLDIDRDLSNRDWQ